MTSAMTSEFVQQKTIADILIGIYGALPGGFRSGDFVALLCCLQDKVRLSRH